MPDIVFVGKSRWYRVRERVQALADRLAGLRAAGAWTRVEAHIDRCPTCTRGRDDWVQLPAMCERGILLMERYLNVPV